MALVKYLDNRDKIDFVIETIVDSTELDRLMFEYYRDNLHCSTAEGFVEYIRGQGGVAMLVYDSRSKC